MLGELFYWRADEKSESVIAIQLTCDGDSGAMLVSTL